MAAETEAPVAPDGPPPTEEPASPVRAPKPPQEKAAKGKSAKAKDAEKKDKKEKKGKKDKQGADGDVEGAAAEGGPSVAAHPRAARAVARSKSWGGLIGFVLGGYLSLPTNTVAAAGLRALIAGVVCYLAVWAGAVFLWRRLVALEIKSREQQLHGAALAATERRQLPAPPAERPGARAAS
ncbi:MAG: hypothetical protein ACRDJX_09640 [Solirubrobacteraceae bacterium]